MYTLVGKLQNQTFKLIYSLLSICCYVIIKTIILIIIIIIILSLDQLIWTKAKDSVIIQSPNGIFILVFKIDNHLCFMHFRTYLICWRHRKKSSKWFFCFFFLNYFWVSTYFKFAFETKNSCKDKTLKHNSTWEVKYLRVLSNPK